LSAAAFPWPVETLCYSTGQLSAFQFSEFKFRRLSADVIPPCETVRVKLNQPAPFSPDSAAYAIGFGLACLIENFNGKFVLCGGLPGDRAAAQECCSRFLHKLPFRTWFESFSVQSSCPFCIIHSSRTLEGTRSMEQQDLKSSEVMPAPMVSGRAMTSRCFFHCLFPMTGAPPDAFQPR
jgi:hypothetical protein